jgi:hypothetical protein
VVPAETVCLHLAVGEEEEEVVVVTKQVYFHLGVEAAAEVEAVMRKQVCYHLVVVVAVEEDTQAVWMINCYLAAPAVILLVVQFARLWTQMKVKGLKISPDPELEAETGQAEEVSCSSRE